MLELSKIFSIKIDRMTKRSTQRVTHYVLFAKPYLHILVNIISPITVNIIHPTIHIMPTILSHIHYNYIDITILLSYCNYIVTIIISTLYSYIYRYNLSIKIYNSQYRYKHIYSIIGMIINNTEMNIYTVYSLYNIQ